MYQICLWQNLFIYFLRGRIIMFPVYYTNLDISLHLSTSSAYFASEPTQKLCLFVIMNH